MEQAACWSRLGRGALLIAAAAIVSALGGCSSSFSRFDFPAFNMTSSDTSAGSLQSPKPQPEADLATTSSLPVPEESVYASSDTRSGVARASLPPVQQSSPAPRVTPASYSPLPNGQPHMQKVAFAGTTPHAEPAVLRVSDEPVSSRKVKVGRGDTLSSLSKHYGVSVEAIKSANNLSDTRLTAGQELIIPAPGSHEATAQAEPDTHVTTAPVAPGWTESPRAASGATYKVQKGDTPHSIAAKNSVAEKDLLAANKLARVDRLQIGQTLIIPDGQTRRHASCGGRDREPVFGSRIRPRRARGQDDHHPRAWEPGSDERTCQSRLGRNGQGGKWARSCRSLTRGDGPIQQGRKTVNADREQRSAPDAGADVRQRQ